MSRLFAPLQLRKLEIRNRIFMPPMCQYAAHEGMPSDWHLMHYGARAAGGTGLIRMEATAVAPEGRITPYDLGLWSDRHAEALRPVVSFIKEQGAAVAVQIAHAGRKACIDKPWQGGAPIAPESGGWVPVAPCAIAFSPGCTVPRELDASGLDHVVTFFANATQRALAAGFDMVEIHMAHGYLLHQFLSPLTNRRTDAYGGSLENRMRLPLRVAEAVRSAWPADKPVMVRISATDWVDNGWDLTSSIEFVRRLKAGGIDIVDVSTGGLTPDAKIPVGMGFQVPFAEAIKKATGMPVSAVGLIVDAMQAESILVTGQADAVSIGRELLRNPSWPQEAAARLGSEAHWPVQYLRAKR